MTPESSPTGTSPGARRIERYAGLFVLVLLLVGSFLVLKPFLTGLAWGIILSFSVWPAYKRLERRLGGRRTLAASVFTLGLTLAVVAPLVIAVANVADDAADLAAATHETFKDGLPPSPAWLNNVPVVGSRVGSYWNSMGQELATLRARSSASTTIPTTLPTTQPAEQSKLLSAARTLLGWAQSFVLTIGLAIGEGIFQVALSLLFMFFVLRDGEALAARMSTMIRRVSGERGIDLFSVAGGTVRGVVYGIIGTALVQGLMAGIGFILAGVPGATLLGLMTFFLSPVPVGPPLIWIPVTIWLFARGDFAWGVFMAIWGVAISSVDNFIKPWLISRGSSMPFVLILIGVLGGAISFGLIGVFIGPTLMAVVYRLVDEWSRRPIAEAPVEEPVAPAIRP